MKILITGGAGFIGSNLALKLKAKYPLYEVIALDNLKRRGSELNLKLLMENSIEFTHGDIRNNEDLSEIEGIDLIIDASAEPSVMAGINSSIRHVVNNNLVGTLNVLDFAQQNKAMLIFLSTSRVYPIERINEIAFIENESRFDLSHDQEVTGVSINGISEQFPITGSRSFYGSSKLASELLIEEYHEYAGLKTIINRCGVVSGPGQMGKVDQGVVVLWMARHFWKKDLSYFGYGGNGKQVRDILHIDDLYELIDMQIHDTDLFDGQVFNVGGGNESSLSLAQLTELCYRITGNEVEIKRVPEDRKADIRIYITDNTKINNLCDWYPKRGSEELLQDIYNWLVNNQSSLKAVLS